MNIRTILRESVRKVLLKQTVQQKVNKELIAGNKNYQNALAISAELCKYRGLPDTEYNEKDVLLDCIMTLDPTADNASGSVGKYTDWIVKYLGVMCHNMSYRDLIFDFDQNKSILKHEGLSANIWDYTPETLYSQAHVTINRVRNAKMSMAQMSQIAKYEGQYEVFDETDSFVVVFAKTWEADKFFGSNTSWCTVGSKGYFDHYHPSGYWIYIPKDENGKWLIDSDERLQFHFKNPPLSQSDINDKFISRNFYCCNVGDKSVYLSNLPDNGLYQTIVKAFESEYVDVDSLLQQG